MKKVLIEGLSPEDFQLVETFIKEHKLNGFIVEESKATQTDFLNDVARVLIPIFSH